MKARNPQDDDSDDGSDDGFFASRQEETSATTSPVLEPVREDRQAKFQAAASEADTGADSDSADFDEANYASSGYGSDFTPAADHATNTKLKALSHFIEDREDIGCRISNSDKMELSQDLLAVMAQQDLNEQDLDAALELAASLDVNGTISSMQDLMSMMHCSHQEAEPMSSTEAQLTVEQIRAKREAMRPVRDLFVPEEGWSESSEDDEPEVVKKAKEQLPWRTGLKICLTKRSPGHIRWTPPEPEPLYYGDRKLLKKRTYLHMATRKGKQQMVFDLRCAAADRKDTLVEELTPYYTPKGEDDETLTFEARFESGNLLCAMQVSEYEYDLILRSDYRTDGWRQWFYFQVGNTRAGVRYRFNILNFSKAESLYNEGMKPCVYSERDATQNGVGWRHEGEDILYYRNYVTRAPGCDPTKYMTLTFSCEFPHDRDTCYLAQVYPYTYMHMQGHLDRLKQDEDRSQWMRVEQEWCKTLAGNKCPCVTVTEFFDVEGKAIEDRNEQEMLDDNLARLTVTRPARGYDTPTWLPKGIVALHPAGASKEKTGGKGAKATAGEKEKGKQGQGGGENEEEDKPFRKKPYIVLSARVHPGESPASLMIEGVLDFLTGDTPEAVELRRRFIFKIVPMLNPDGVILGNSRCHGGGADLNRRYQTATKETTPTIFALKSMVKELQANGEVLLFADVHGHSRRQEVFMFGNGEKESRPGAPCRQRLLPMLLEQHSTNDLFSMEGCSWYSHAEKQATCRVLFWKELKVVFSYTLESSLCGTNKGYHLHEAHLHQVGYDFAKALSNWSDDERIHPGLSPTGLLLNPCADPIPPQSKGEAKSPKNGPKNDKRMGSTRLGRTDRGLKRDKKERRSLPTDRAGRLLPPRRGGEKASRQPSRNLPEFGRKAEVVPESPLFSSSFKKPEKKLDTSTSWGKSPARFAQTVPSVGADPAGGKVGGGAAFSERSPTSMADFDLDRKKERIALPRIMNSNSRGKAQRRQGIAATAPVCLPFFTFGPPPLIELKV